MMNKPASKALRPLLTGMIENSHQPLLLVFVLCLCIGQQAFAAAQDPAIEQLNQLVAANRYEDAYNVSKEMMKEHEGEPEFDFLFGLSALETGRPNEAVFALERITYSYPDQMRVKLELARAFFQLNNYQASRELFNEVLGTNPTDNVKANIKVFLNQITERENDIAGSFDFFVSANLGSDSNINSATSLGVVAIPGIGNVTLSSNGTSINDNFNELGAGVAYNKPFSKTSGLTLTGNLNRHDNFSSNDFDIDVFAADATYFDINGNIRMSYGLKGQLVNLNGERFQDSSSLLVSMTRSPGDGWTQSLTGAYTLVRYDDGLNKNASLRDVNQALVSGALGKAVGKFNHTVSIYYGDEHAVNSAGENNAQQFYGVAFAEQYQLDSKNVPYFRIAYHHSENKKEDAIFSLVENTVRSDNALNASLGWVWLMNTNVNITSDVTYTNNDSNLALYKYDRLKFQTGVRYQF
jgi:tetratricopeptide (TPR) repeat protein